MGKKRSAVLQGLGIMTPEDILDLSLADEEILAFQQVAGGEWAGAGVSSRPKAVAKILSFPRPEAQTLKPYEIESLHEESDVGNETSSYNELPLDFILTQRKLWKEGVEALAPREVIDQYLGQPVFKIEKDKKRYRLYLTEGVLVNKKQS